MSTASSTTWPIRSKIDRVRILSKDGTIIHSTYAPEVGQTVDGKAETCSDCHQSERPIEQLIPRRADLDVQGRRRPVAARQHGSHPQRTVLLQRRLPSALEGDAVLGVLDIIYSLDDINRKLAHQHARDRRRFVGLHRDRGAVGRLFRAPPGLFAAARPRKRRATTLRRQSGPADPGAQRRRIRQACLLVQRHDRRLAQFARAAAAIGAIRSSKKSKSGRRNCAARKPKPCAARSSPRSGCSPPASPTN